jgi:diacylglycerol kinase (ATP)
MTVAKAHKIKSLHIIINPAAGKNLPILAVLNTAFKEADLEWEIFITKKAGDAIDFAKKAVEEKIDAVAVFGGDGTLMEVMTGLLGSDVPLFILPGGSANVMATELGVPKDLELACQLITEGHGEIRTIDVGQFNKRKFIVGVSMGFEAEVIKDTGREAKNRLGIIAYILTGMAALKKLKEVTYHLKIDGKDYKVKGINCIVSNAGNFGFTDISLDRHIDVSDGMLDVLVLRKANFNLLKHVLITFFKHEPPDNRELVQHWQGKDVSVTSHPQQRVQCDGEPLEKIPVHVKVVPAAIQVFVPKKSENAP